MAVLVICENEEDPEWSQHYTLIFRRSKAANSIVSDGIWPKFDSLMKALKWS